MSADMKQPETFNNWKIGDRLEAKDFMNVWYPSRVVAYDDKEDCILVHFEGWNQRFDEWFPINCDRIRPLTRELKPHREIHKFFSTQFLKVGQYVLAPWKDGESYPGKIEKINHKQKKYKVSFLDGATRNVPFRKVQVMTDEDLQELINNLGTSDSLSTSTLTNSSLEVDLNFSGEGESHVSVCKSSSHTKTNAKHRDVEEEGDGPQKKKTRGHSTSTSSRVSAAESEDRMDQDPCHLCVGSESLLKCKDCSHFICLSCRCLLESLNKDVTRTMCLHCIQEKYYSNLDSFSSPDLIRVIRSLEDLQKCLKISEQKIKQTSARHGMTEDFLNKSTSNCDDIRNEQRNIEDILNNVEEFVGRYM